MQINVTNVHCGIDLRSLVKSFNFNITEGQPSKNFFAESNEA